MIGIDTNVLLRLLLQDDATQARQVRSQIEAAEASGVPIFINDIVLCETLWTLRARFASDKDELVATLRGLLAVASFAFESRDTLQRTLATFERSTAGFSDCLIAAKNVATGCGHTATLDRAMGDLPGVKLLSGRRQ